MNNPCQARSVLKASELVAAKLPFDNRHLGAYNYAMRRKPGTLIDIEIAILSAALLFLSRGEKEFHGYQLAREIKMANGERYRSAAGTLYRALDRMEAAGFLRSSWEDPADSSAEGRPPRRLYTLTSEGEAAYKAALRELPDGAVRPGWQPV